MDPFNAKNILSKNRTQWIDYDKGISIILVGYGHTYAILQGHGLDFQHYPFFNYIGVFLYGFRMPLFFIISGMLIGNALARKSLGDYIKSRASNILHPLMIWGVIEITIKVFSSGRISSGPNLVMEYLNLLIDPRKTGVFWYLNSLFCIGTLYAINKVKFKLRTGYQFLIGFILYCLSAYIHINELSAGFLTDIFEYYIFFATGDFISKFMLSSKGRSYFTSAKVYIPLLLVFLALQFYATEINLGNNSSGMAYVEKKFPFLFLTQAFIGCAMSMSISFLLQKHQKLIFLRVIGFHSLFIYCMQIIVMNFIRILFSEILGVKSVPTTFILTWVLGIALPIIIYNLSLRLHLWWLYTFFRPKLI